MKYNKKKIIYDFRRYSAIQNVCVKCKCGHSVFLPYYNPVKICSHCGYLVFKNEKAKFMYYLGKKTGLEID